MAAKNFIVDSLPAYVQENKDVLLKNFALAGEGIRKRISIQTGIKSSARLNYLEIVPEFQQGGDCAFTPQGAVELTQRTIETTPTKINLEICPQTLRGKYAEYLIKSNATDQELPFEAYITEGLVNEINKQMEVAIWERIMQIVTTGTHASYSESAYETIKNVYFAMPEEVLEKGGEIYVSPAMYRQFLQELVDKNFYHYASAEEAAPQEFYLPGTDVKVVKSYGMANGKVVGTFAKNLFYGCDMENDDETIEIWWSKDDRNIKVAVEWNWGAQVAFPDMVVIAEESGDEN
jgi:hypothetical protein